MPWPTTPTESAGRTVDANYEAFLNSGGAPIIIELNPHERARLTFNVKDVGDSDTIEIGVFEGVRLAVGGDLDGVTSTTDIELETGLHTIDDDDEFNGYYIALTSGAAKGDVRLITDSVAADDGVILDHALQAAAAAADTYDLYRMGKTTALAIDTTIAIDEDNPMNRTIIIEGGPFVLIMVRATGATDAHVVYMSFSKDEVDA